MHICFVTVNSDLALTDGDEEGLGGEAVQHALLAREFRRQGHDVSMVVLDRGQQDGAAVDGITLWTSYREKAGIPVLRFFHPRISSLWSAMARADADVYYQSPAGTRTGLTALFCKLRRRPFLFRVASDANCIPGQQLIRYKRDKMIYDYGLRSADVVAAQTSTQIALLREHYMIEAELVPMVTEIPEEPSADTERDVDVLWVSNLRDVKRPEMLLDLAARLPDVRFVMVGGSCPGSEGLYRAVEARAASIPNVEFLGFQPNRTVNQLLTRTKLFLNTSTVEGFPNTFLQAWARKVPVVSFFDPDGLIASQRLGAVVTTFDELVNAAGELLGDGDRRTDIGSRARRFVCEHNRAGAVVRRYLDLIEGLEMSAARRRGARSP